MSQENRTLDIRINYSLKGINEIELINELELVLCTTLGVGYTLIEEDITKLKSELEEAECDISDLDAEVRELTDMNARLEDFVKSIEKGIDRVRDELNELEGLMP